MSDISERLLHMQSDEKRALLAQLLRKQGSKSTSSSPLSYGQSALWFLYQSAPESAAYHVGLPVRVRSQVDVPALRRAFQALINRHPALRTSFPTRDGQPVQEVHGYQEVHFEEIDASSWTWEELHKRAVEAYQRPFDLERGPVLRASLFTRSAQDHVLLLILHHIVCDGWSIWMLLHELRVLYPAEQAGTRASLPPLNLAYTDYVRWQADLLAGPEGKRLWEYWRQQLAPELPVLNLPTDRPRPPVQTSHGASYAFTLSDALTQQLNTLARTEGATLYMTLLAALYAQLLRYTGQEDILVGSPTAGRTQTEFAGIVGYFVDPVVLRANLAGNPTFKALLHQVRHTVLDAIAHQDFPFQLLVERLHPERDPSRSPIFQVLFLLQTLQQSGEIAEVALQGTTRTRVEWGGLALEPYTLAQDCRFDLTLHMVEGQTSLRGVFEYNSDLFDAATIRRLADNFQTLLHGVVAHPAVQVAALPLLSAAERQQVLVAWNATQTSSPHAPGVPEAIAAQAARTPEAVAVVYEAQQLAYGALEARANQLAHHLRTLGVGPEVRVGVCLERSLELVVALLGVLKAGGAYVPLDPTYPQERLAFMLHDAQVQVLLTHPLCAALVPETVAVPVLDLERDWAVVARQSSAPCASGAEPANLMYVIYTSGSTGQPKGVMNTHAGLGNRLWWMQQTYPLTGTDRVLQKTSCSFDVSVWEFFWPLMTGACLVLAQPGGQQDSTYVLQVIAEEQITTLHFVPSMLQLFVAEAELERCRSVRQVFSSGEALPAEVAERMLGRLGCELHNLYGPTEAAIDVTFWPCERASSRGTVPIGRPIANTDLYVLDRQGEPVPIGVAGELHIGGVGVARGYLGRAGLTAECFVPHPWCKAGGGRLYRTGDLVRYRADGALEFLGRLDYQVKVRGFRIELGEIETVLGQHPAVASTVVMAREAGPNELQLVAYMVPELGGASGEAAVEGVAQVEQWQTVFGETYRQAAPEAEPTFNIVGWNDSYTGQPIPAAEMRTWVETTVARIRAYAPRRVLEIGCGTGLVLFRLAPACEHYWGTDIAPEALRYIADQLKAQGFGEPQVRLLERGADDFTGIEAEAWDAVILNSVVQYFPSVEYLLQVLEGAVRAVAPGGVVFIGDVRSLPLLEAFHATVQVQQAPATLAREHLRQRVQESMRTEAELAVDPAFFTAVAQWLPQISGVEVQLKRGAVANELTQFRYDVVLHVGGLRPATGELRWLEWQQVGGTVSGLRQWLAETAPAAVGVRGVPNARVQAAVRLVELLHAAAGPSTVGSLREAMHAVPREVVVEPEAIWAVGETLGYMVQLSEAGPEALGCFDVVLQRQGEAGGWPGLGVRWAAQQRRPWQSYATQPLQGHWLRQLVPQVRQYLSQRLPAYLVPGAFVVIERLPLTPNGKVDRRALPAPDPGRRRQVEGYVAPRTATEVKVAALWEEVLGLEQVGLHDNFFDWGGHSLLATQLISRVRASFATTVPVRSIFEAPTVASLSAYIDAQRHGNEPLPASPMVPVARAGELPLSFAQQRLWFLDQLEGGSATYNVPAALRLRGDLNVTALARSLTDLVQRHEALRTTFPMVQGVPVQVIAPSQPVSLPIVDMQGLPIRTQAAEIRRLAMAEAQLPFHLADDALLRVTLLRLRAAEHVLLVTMHHIVSDGWSLGILVREATALYAAYCRNEASPLPTLPIQYADFAHWQRQWLQGEVLDAHLAYWRQQLAGASAVLNLPTDRPHPPVQTFQGAVERFRLSQDLTQQLETLSRASGATLYMTLLGAFTVLLARYSGQDDLVVGSVIANRTRQEIESLIGFFVNTLALHIDLSGNPTFHEVLGRVRQIALAAYEHQDLPFEKLVEELQPERSLSHTPLFQVVFVLQNAPVEKLDIPGLTLTPLGIEHGLAQDTMAALEETLQGQQGPWEYSSTLFDTLTMTRMAGQFQRVPEQLPGHRGQRISELEVESGTAKFDLTLAMEETEQGLRAAWEYNSDLFDAATIRRMAGHFETLLAGLVAHPAERVATVPLLTDAERHQLLVTWNDTQAAYPQDQCVHHLFEAQAARAPDATAIASVDQHLTYQQLDGRANQLAHYLRALGVGPGVLVGVCTERSPEMIVGLLGILKAGGAYLPLDPAYPKQRLAFMLEDARISVLLTQAHLVARLPAYGAHVLCLDADWSRVAQARAERPASGVTAEHLAYMIYTSGSTGRPKGVLIPHRGLLNLVYWHQHTFAITTADRATQLAGTAFDASVWEVWPYLAAGASLYLVAPDLLTSPTSLRDWLVTHTITVSFLPTPLAERLLRLEWPAYPALRIMLTGGDTLHQYPPTTLPFTVVNNYGPTENTVVTTSGAIVTNGRNDLSPPIGRPITNNQVYILDAHLQPLPIGIPGELHIGGASLAQGYLNRPLATAEQFLPHPFSAQPATRLYKTGDLARYLPDGTIEFLGRIDQQVKIRGFRIELGEIEAALAGLPVVQEALVTAREVQDDKRLVAYVVPNLQGNGMPTQGDDGYTEHIAQWQKLYEETYRQPAAPQDLTFNVTGWNSSYTSLPIPEEEMREWVEHTVEQILALHPKRVLEIGCGTGLLLSRIAPHCTQYWGTDFSSEALRHVQQLQKAVQGLEHVTLRQSTADDFGGLEAENFDTVILNSVVQYFPSIDYLLRVLAGAVQVVQPAGHIFVGDVRSLPLLRAYHASVQYERAPAGLSRAQLQQRVQHALAQEEELVIDPAFFLALRQQLPQIRQVWIRPKRGHHHNELTRFRYEAILRVGEEPTPTLVPPVVPRWLDWHKEQLTLSEVRRCLTETQPESIGLRGVSNARIQTEMKILEWLNEAADTQTVRDLQHTLAQHQHEGIEPEALWGLSREVPYDIDLSWSQTNLQGAFDVVCRRQSSSGQEAFRRAVAFLAEPVGIKPWSDYANNPLQEQLRRQLVPSMRSALQEILPDYMVPSAFVVLEKLPLTPNGKVDRRALPAPDSGGLAGDFGAPRTPTEELVAGIWTQVLGLEQVSIHANFFDLGGHSLLATQLISRIRDVFSLELPLRCLFEASTVAGLSEHIETASRESQSQMAPPIVRCPRDGNLPLSFAQQRLWFLDQLEGTSATYNVPGALRLLGALDIAALAHSLTEVVRRHEALRTTFAMVDGTPVQLIALPAAVPLPVVNLQGLSAQTQEIEVHRLLTAEAQRPFVLAQDALLRTTLLRLGAQEHVLLVTMHHIVSDGWSMGVMTREVATLYETFCRGVASPLSPLPIQYADFAQWQRVWLQGEALAHHLAYWQAQLAGAPALLELPTDRPRPPVQTFRGGLEYIHLRPELTQQLKTLSRQAETTLFMTLLGGFATLLGRYSGHNDLIIGSPIANRTHQETEGLIGFFVNTLALRLDLSGDPTCHELLARVRQITLDAYAHQDLPFEKLVEELQPMRHLSHAPLFQVMFILQNTPRRPLALSGLTLSSLALESTQAKFDLTLTLEEMEQGLHVSWEYNRDLFEAATIRRMAGHFQRLLEGLVAHPEQCVSALPMLTEAECHQLLVTWNATRTTYPQDVCLHQAFEMQVTRTPEAIAVACDDRCLTYQALRRRANQLAHYLLALGVGPEVRVGICLERSLEMVVGILGILKAGGAYVPLEPTYPQERLAFILHDAQISVLLTQERLASVLSECPARVVYLDAECRNIAQESTENPVHELTSKNLAYVLYTSGSTGIPKGVLGLHRGAVNRLAWMWHTYPFGAEEVNCQKTSFNFVDSVWELFGALLQGIRTVIIPDAMVQDSQQLVQTLAVQRVTRIVLVPSLLQAILDVGGDLQRQLSMLKFWTTSGEALSADLYRRFRRCLPQSILLNIYGCSEVAADVTWYDTGQTPADGTHIPIGRPIANTQIYLLDADYNPVPIGVTGEVYAGGDGVARGYLNRPGLTAERFIPHPFGPVPGACLYKTGDLARYVPDGTLEFLGRIDYQVQIRGYRIELGEIETALRQHPAVHEVAVIAPEDVPGTKRLVAYLVSEQSAACSPSSLRSFLKTKIPDYMIPNVFVTMDALPLTPNGKVNRQALPLPGSVASTLGYTTVAPRTPTEDLLAGLWADVLGLDHIGVNHNFFDLGGHSLLATLLISRLRTALAVELSVRQIFEAPTVAELSVTIDAVRRREQAPFMPPLHPVARTGDLPLSFTQQRLWFLDQLEGGSAPYNIPAAQRLSGPLDVAALAESLTALVQRHEALRSTFPTIRGVPVQVIAPSQSVLLPLVDLQTLPDEAQAAEVRRVATTEARRPFDLAQGPLLRVTLLRQRAQEHVLLITIHHIVSDGWSMEIMMREMAILYDACVSGRAPLLPALPIQYADFAHWQRTWLQGEVLETQIAYWQQQLAGAPTVLELPTDRPRPPVQAFRGGIETFSVDPELTAQLVRLSRQAGVTLFMTVLGVFATFLARYSGQEDLVIGSPIANRTHRETEGMIGFFVNMLALRLNLAGSPTFHEVLARVRQVALAAYAHQDLPFEKLVEELQPERHLSHPPLFQVVFVLQHAPQEPLCLSDLTLTPFTVESGMAKFDLILALQETAQEMRGVWEYNRDLFDAATVARMTGHFLTLLAGVVAQPAQCIALLPLLTAAERQQLLTPWPDLYGAAVQDQCLHQWFEAQVARTPDLVAVTCDEQQLTYRALNRRANQLAHHLRTLGVGPDELAGLCVERSLDMIVGLLGILKAGGAYVPLDPAYPPERLAFMLADAQVRVLVTQTSLAAGLPVQDMPVVCVDTDWAEIARQRTTDLISEVVPANAAYVIYTSGSTGRPKGVVVPHAQVVRLFAATQAWFNFGNQDVWTLFHSAAFDFSVWELWGALLYGGRLVLVPLWMSRAPDAFYAQLIREGVTVLNQTPSAFHQLLRVEQEAEAVSPLDLRLVIFGGEALELQSLQPWFARRGDQCPQLVNMYGITETTVHVTYRPLACADLLNPGSTIGIPIPDLQVYLLDQHLQLVPTGVPGETYIGGAGVTRGYLQRPGLTAERFVPHPFSPHPGARLYKSGDLARYRRQGDLEYLGRLDDQVKIRGFRVELGEIETVLASHPVVREAVVRALEDRIDSRRLVAYVVAHQKDAATVSELRTFVQAKLPAYMVPSAFVLLDALPLTPNGKVDRHALPTPDPAERGVTGRFVVPRTPTEELVASLLADVLGLERVGIYDNFFELGGHSLLATQLVSRLRLPFAVEVPVRSVFDAPTVAELSTYIETVRREALRPLAPPIVPVARADDLPLSFAQQRLWFLDQLEERSATYNIPVALRLSGPLDVAALMASVTALAQRHEALRTTFPAMQGVPVQVIAPSQPVPLPLIDLQAVPDGVRVAEVNRLAAAEARRPFDLAQDPLLRVTLLRLRAQEHVLLVTLHHIVADGWSMGVLIHEVAALYDACVSSQPSPLPPLPIQYADFAHWQRDWLQGGVLEAQLAYWRQQLAGAPAMLDLPTDRPRPPVQTFLGRLEYFRFSPDLTRQLTMLSQQADVTLFMTLLGAFTTFLYRYSGHEDLVVGSPIANRNRQETEGLIGFFVNTLPLRLDLAGNPPFNALLDQVREVTLTAYAHQDIPFEKLVEELQPERSLSHTPLFQVMLVLQNAPWRPLELPELTLTPVATESGTSKCDLTLRMWETTEGIQGEWEYSSDLFDVATIRRMHGQFETLLRGVVADPTARVGALPLLSVAERQQMLVGWNTTQTIYPEAQSVPEAIAAQAALTPEAVAVVAEAQQLTYRALEARANQLAQHLRTLGVGPEVRVGVCLERSLELVIALLGVLKAGGAYVPLDPAYPAERLTFMLHDAQVQVLLTHTPCAAAVPAVAVPVLWLDLDWSDVAQQPSGPCASGAGPANLMYVIYTSGSTGQPKGAMNTHAGLRNRLWWMQQTYPLTGADRVLQKTPCSFDVSVWEFFWPLMTGACLVLAQPGGHQDSGYVVEVSAQQQITTLHFVPSMLQLFVAEARVESCKSLRRVFCSGEALPVDLPGRFVERLGCELHNLYGPTEAAIDVTFWPCERTGSRGTVPIGRPIANTDLYVLDRQGEPVPIGVAGELHIGGMGVARGYLGQPGLTAERFVPHLWSMQPGGRLYKTGDLVRYAQDGTLEFLGRLDYQVKLRGFRIELGEIETVLGQHPAVVSTVVVAREEAPGDSRLVAYVVPDLAAAGPGEGAARGSEAQAAQVSQWQQVFGETYRQGAPGADPTFNTVGWNDSYTGQPIPEAEMRTWVETTVARIRAYAPRRVLELGCGTGLLLFRLAPHAEQYWGTDISAEALAYIAHQLAATGQEWPQVRLLERGADDWTGLAPGSWDAVILNSVVQYFPSVEYLLRVLEGAVRLLAPGGVVFIGDVRSLPLLEVFHASVQVQRAPATLSRAQLRQRVQDSLHTEAELVIDPEFFWALPERLRQIRQVEIQLKRGETHNELTRFRYDVILHVGEVESSKSLLEVPWLEWQQAGLTVAGLRQRLLETPSEVLGVRGVPNARVQEAVRLVELLHAEGGPVTVGELCDAVQVAPVEVGVDPEAMWALGEEMSYTVMLSESGPEAPGCFNVVLQRQGALGERPWLAGLRVVGLGRSWASYATQPLQGQWLRQLGPQLRQYLNQRVPEYMVPGTFVVLETLPLTPNGKVDRRALPVPDPGRRGHVGGYVAPRTATEVRVAALWGEVLGLTQVGLHDNFFEWGGHSLLATQLISRVREAFQVEIPLRDLFETPTVADLAERIETVRWALQGLQTPPSTMVDDREEGTL